MKRSFLLVLAAIALLAALASSLILATPKPPTVDQRVQRIASQLKCPVCQGESVADSSAQLALQMRQRIRQDVQAGKSDQEITQFFVDRYGAGIAWSPPWQGFSLLAWLVPIALLLAGCWLLYTVVREWRHSAPVVTEGPRSFDLVGSGEREDDELARYRAQLEQELAEDDVIFKRAGTEVR